MSNCEPAASVLPLCGSRAEIARELGVAESTVGRWLIPRGGRGEYPRGTGGAIPEEYHADLIRMARARGKKICKKDLRTD